MSESFCVYGRDSCHWCAKVQELLRERDIPFEYITIDSSKALPTGSDGTLPQVTVDGKLVGGFRALNVFLRDRELATGDSFTCTTPKGWGDPYDGSQGLL